MNHKEIYIKHIYDKYIIKQKESIKFRKEHSTLIVLGAWNTL